MHSSHYQLRCLGCGTLYSDSEIGFFLNCEHQHEPSLLRSSYSRRTLTVRSAEQGLFRFADWLPVRRTSPNAPGPIVFRSLQLGARIGLDNLFIIFNGYWPERRAYMTTCSFKELEAYSVLGRIPDGESRSLVVASAGNTGRAFLQVASEQGVPVVVVVPEFALPHLWITVPLHPSVRIVVLSGNSDYYDAIKLADLIAGMDGCFAEGGARNIARRDGMGTTMLEAAVSIGRIPQHYVQAVGSGTGGIAAWEMMERLLADGSYGDTPGRLHLVQNAPFSLMTDSWATGSAGLAPLDERVAREQIRELHAAVLSNRHPPYSIRGGVRDVLTQSDGRMYSVTNRDALEAGRLFADLEGCDLDPAAEVALAGLIQSVRNGAIGHGEVTALNVTGGGMNNIERTGRKRYLKPDIIFDADELKGRRDESEIRELVESRMREVMKGVQI
ncbi:MAG TPA: cysteate synthase [Spirochaetia bacterium]|nr:cysteate synthase [Spirochaetia bacterium]